MNRGKAAGKPGVAIVIGVGKALAKPAGKVGQGSASKPADKSVAARDRADKAYDKSHGIKQGSAADKRLDKKNGVYDYEYGSKSGGKVGVGGTLTAGQRNALPSSKFGLPGKGEGKSGKGSGAYPMPDKSHAVAAKGFAKRFASPAQRAQIDRKANAVIKGAGGSLRTANKSSGASPKGGK